MTWSWYLQSFSLNPGPPFSVHSWMKFMVKYQTTVFRSPMLASERHLLKNAG